MARFRTPHLPAPGPSKARRYRHLEPYKVLGVVDRKRGKRIKVFGSHARYTPCPCISSGKISGKRGSIRRRRNPK